VVPQNNAHVLDEGLEGNVSVLIEPLACALYGMRRLRPKPGQSAIIFGAGTMGLLLGLLLRLQDIDPVLFVEPNPARRELAKRLASATAVTPAEAQGVEAPLVIDASGNPEAISALVYHAAPGATVMLFGLASRDALSTFPPYRVLKRDLTIVGSMAILHTFEEAVRVATRHARLFAPLVTHEFALEGFRSAFEALTAGSSVKACLVPEPALARTRA
jgi:NADPH2:quinone reductase